MAFDPDYLAAITREQDRLIRDALDQHGGQRVAAHSTLCAVERDLLRDGFMQMRSDEAQRQQWITRRKTYRIEAARWLARIEANGVIPPPRIRAQQRRRKRERRVANYLLPSCA